MAYKIIFKKSAEKSLAVIPGKIAEKIVLKVYALKDEPRPDGVKKLSGSENLYRIRIGDYRVIYSIYDNILLIEVIRIGHRRDIYR
jgi:mRNA interferase RelE/StbE